MRAPRDQRTQTELVIKLDEGLAFLAQQLLDRTGGDLKATLGQVLSQLQRVETLIMTQRDELLAFKQQTADALTELSKDIAELLARPAVVDALTPAEMADWRSKLDGLTALGAATVPNPPAGPPTGGETDGPPNPA